jgi:hypothetical protein
MMDNSHPSTDYRFFVAWKRAATESGNYTVNGINATSMMGAISVYRNCVTTGNPYFETRSSVDYITNDQNLKAQYGFTPNCGGMYVWTGFAQGATQTITTPSGVTQREYPALTNNTRLFIGDKTYVNGSGTTGSVIGALGTATAIKRAEGFVLKGIGATWVAVNNNSLNAVSFVIQSDPHPFGAPADATNYYYGSLLESSFTTSAAMRQIVLPFNCTLVGFSVTVRADAGASNEKTTLYVKVNNTTDYQLSNLIDFSGGTTSAYYSSGILSNDYTAGDKIELHILTPTWVTNPANIRTTTVLYFKNR